jgi:hypothetical protein
MMLGIFCYSMPLHFGILYLLYSIYGMKAKNDNIGHTAILGRYRRLFDYIAQEPSLLVDHTLMVLWPFQ